MQVQANLLRLMRKENACTTPVTQIASDWHAFVDILLAYLINAFDICLFPTSSIDAKSMMVPNYHWSLDKKHCA